MSIKQLEKTGQWWERSWNPIRFGSLDDLGWMCTKISPGCLHCYSERINIQFGNGCLYTERNAAHSRDWRLDEKILDKPLHWRKPRRIFVMDMGDLFHEQIPDIFIDKIMAVMALCPQHTFLSLTKRPERMTNGFERSQYLWKDFILPEVDKMQSTWQSPCHYFWPLPNLWLGVTVESEKYLHRINALNEIPTAHKFVSLEPLLEEIHIEDYLKHLQWVCVGPETGPQRRPCKIEWLEGVVEQCDAAKVPVWVKAVPIGNRISHNIKEFPPKLQRREFPVDSAAL